MMRRRNAWAGGLVAATLAVAGCGGSDEPDCEGPERTACVASLGMAIVTPEGWVDEVEDDVIELRSEDRSINVTLSSPLSGRRPADVKSAVREQFEQQLTEAEVTESGDAKLGERNATSLAVSGELEGRPVTGVAIVDDTTFRTYLVRVLIFPTAQETTLRELRAVLRSVVLTEPESERDE